MPGGSAAGAAGLPAGRAHDSGDLQASGIDPEEAFGCDVFEGLIEGHDERAKVTRSNPGRSSSPSEHLNTTSGSGPLDDVQQHFNPHPGASRKRRPSVADQDIG